MLFLYDIHIKRWHIICTNVQKGNFMLVLFDMAEHIALVREYKTLYIDYYALIAYCEEKVYRKALENLTKAENAKISFLFQSSSILQWKVVRPHRNPSST